MPASSPVPQRRANAPATAAGAVPAAPGAGRPPTAGAVGARPAPARPARVRPAGSSPVGPGRQDSLRAHNLAVLTTELFGSGRPLSRADLAGRTGLTRSTVSRLVEDLLGAGIVAELPASAGLRGRPAVPLAPAGRTFAGLGLEVNVDYLAVRVLDLRGEVLAARTVGRDLAGSPAAAVLTDLAGLATAALAEAGADRLVGSVLAVPGLVGPDGRRLLLAPNLGWADLEPARFLALPADVEVVNEAKLAALAAAHAAPGRLAGAPTFFYLSAHVGIGAATVLDGRLADGPRGWAGEVGHVAVEPDGPRCRCGARGCLEQYAGKQALRAAAGLPATAPPAEVLRLAAEPGSPARAALDRAGWALGVVLAGVVNILDVEEIVLGGELAPFLDHLRPGIEAELGRRVLAAPWSTFIVRADGASAPAATGGALRALARVVAEPARWVGPR
ncbi:ROK family transcriptional regulator [Georgenia sp. TF02-10]|uniref:ROK family protein n=1 Tax=Georgenia sp. TF02-10 TaxID=2917725 RepID=UPI001FA7DF06|nr:ROK family protein [Georgenia sp. TF02-10]UNX54453.1 ROK family transcriptional regulator [Georgenia sp. TF02-10]